MDMIGCSDSKCSAVLISNKTLQFERVYLQDGIFGKKQVRFGQLVPEFWGYNPVWDDRRTGVT